MIFMVCKTRKNIHRGGVKNNNNKNIMHTIIYHFLHIYFLFCIIKIKKSKNISKRHHVKILSKEKLSKLTRTNP
jgi:hypothetical protein